MFVFSENTLHALIKIRQRLQQKIGAFIAFDRYSRIDSYLEVALKAVRLAMLCLTSALIWASQRLHTENPFADFKADFKGRNGDRELAGLPC